MPIYCSFPIKRKNCSNFINLMHAMQVQEMLKGGGGILQRMKTFQNASRQEDISHRLNLLLESSSPKCKDNPNQQNQAV